MKPLALILSMTLLTTGARAQGLISFANGPTTLFSVGSGIPGTPFIDPVGAFYFALLTNSTPTGTFTFTGIYATNTATGRLGPAAYTPAVPGWAPGQALFYEVAGWSARLGMTFDPAWLRGDFPVSGYFGFFGLSAVASGTAGGGSPVPAPAFPLFGGTGLQGFILYPVLPIPEPTVALLIAGATVLMVRRRGVSSRSA